MKSLATSESVPGMKTYFIAGRSKEFESISNQFVAVSDSECSREPAEPKQTPEDQRLSFRKVTSYLRRWASTTAQI